MMKKEDFDVVQDISGYTPDDVKPLFEAFKGRIGHYIFAGSTVIYADTNVLPIRESSPIDLGPKQGDYGKNKSRRRALAVLRIPRPWLPGISDVVLDGLRAEQRPGA